MRIVEQSFEYGKPVNGEAILKHITKVGYVSHNTHKEIDLETAKKFVKRHCIESKPPHGTLLEFDEIEVFVVTDRAIANELVRHRIASYNQQSTRYVKFDDLPVIPPLDIQHNKPQAFMAWYRTCKCAENGYVEMIRLGATPEEARDALPLSAATEIVMHLNLRAWRHFFELRYEKHAHPKMIALAEMILKDFKRKIPVVFDDFEDI